MLIIHKDSYKHGQRSESGVRLPLRTARHLIGRGNTKRVIRRGAASSFIPLCG
jgi:hypothetical protein